jgi:hypothetical protein
MSERDTMDMAKRFTLTGLVLPRLRKEGFQPFNLFNFTTARVTLPLSVMAKVLNWITASGQKAAVRLTFPLHGTARRNGKPNWFDSLNYESCSYAEQRMQLSINGVTRWSLHVHSLARRP